MEHIEKAIRWFENIAEECDKLTSGNVAHLRAQIKGMAIRSAEYLKKHNQEPASEDLEKCVVEQMEADGDVDDFVRRGIDDIASKYAQLGAQWQKEQMMKDAVEAVVSQVPCANEIIFRNPASVSYWYLPSEMNRLGVNKGDKVKVIIVKDND